MYNIINRPLKLAKYMVQTMTVKKWYEIKKIKSLRTDVSQPTK